jgi:hypothetical protein
MRPVLAEASSNNRVMEASRSRHPAPTLKCQAQISRPARLCLALESLAKSFQMHSRDLLALSGTSPSATYREPPPRPCAALICMESVKKAPALRR